MTDIFVEPTVTVDVVVPGLLTADLGIQVLEGSVLDVAVGYPGPPGPPGPPGMVRVNHLDDPDLPRPDAPIVLWVGSVIPTYRDEVADLIAWTV